MDAAIKLYDYQKRWIEDKARFKVGLWCRQSGKSFAVALEAVLDAVETGHNWVLLSSGERQSKELMEKVKMHLEAMKIAAGGIKEDFFADTNIRQLSIELPNGARIIGLPANPDTARGFSANVILDEFAFHKDSNRIWTALFPTISRGYKIRIVSTPQGMKNKFYELWSSDNNYSKHKTDIYEAVEQGLPVIIAELKEGIDDPDAWQQEYECLFIDEQTAWLTYEMIAACQVVTLEREISYDDVSDDTIKKISDSISGRGFAGLDIARRRDLTILDIEDQVGDVYWQRAAIVFPKIRITEQKLILWKFLAAIRKIERICIDSTGIGLTIGEDTAEKFGQYRAEIVEFNNKNKQDMAIRTRNNFEDRLCRIPADRNLRDDLHAVKKITTAAGNVRFDAERTDKGHSDRFWAKALAFMASDSGAKPQVILISA